MPAQAPCAQLGLPPAKDSGLFGLDFQAEEALLHIIPVPWELTTSYGQGTAKAPKAILKASHQLDLMHLQYGKAYEKGIKLLDEDPEIQMWGSQAQEAVDRIHHAFDHGQYPSREDLAVCNQASHSVDNLVYKQARKLLQDKKRVGVLGGDHSSPYGLIKALSESYHSEDWGILHIDAHHDLREAYQGFECSHASIMFNASRISPHLKLLQQWGIRDFSQEEYERAKGPGFQVIYDQEFQEAKSRGQNIPELFKREVAKLPKHVYVSFDIDGLDPSLCPSTGTPVPSGFNFAEAKMLLGALALEQKTIIGFDLCEVSSAIGSEWDANVGARILYELCALMLSSPRF